jgi:hypothetical protein
MGFDYRTIQEAENDLAAVERGIHAYELDIRSAAQGLSALSAAEQVAKSATRGLADLDAARRFPRLLAGMNSEPSAAKAALGLTSEPSVAKAALGLADVTKVGAMSAGIREATRAFNSSALNSLTQGLANNRLSQLNNYISALRAPSAFATFAEQLAGLGATQRMTWHDPWKPVMMRWSRPPSYTMAERLLADLRHPSASIVSAFMQSESSSLMRTMQAFRSDLVAAHALPLISPGLFDTDASFDASWDIDLTRRKRRVRARQQIGGTVIAFPDTRTTDPVSMLFSLLPVEQAQMVLAKVLEIAKTHGPAAALTVLLNIISALMIYYVFGLH